MAEENLNSLSREELSELPDEIEGKQATDDAPLENSPPNGAPPESDTIENSPREEKAPDESLAEAPQKKRKRSRSLLRIISKVCAALVVTSAIVVLMVNFAFPIVRIYGSSMSSTLIDGDIVIALKTTSLEKEDICAFNYGSRILCKRVIGLEGDVIEINDEGAVFVNGNELDEPYAKGRSLGSSDMEFPLTVPKDSYFVLGDNRRNSIDSRNSVIGCVSKDQVVGKLIFCVLPIPSFGKIE